MADRESEALVFVERAFDRRQRGPVGAMRAVVAADPLALDDELVDMRRARIGAPAASIPVGVLGEGGSGGERKADRRETNDRSNGRPPPARG